MNSWSEAAIVRALGYNSVLESEAFCTDWRALICTELFQQETISQEHNLSRFHNGIPATNLVSVKKQIVCTKAHLDALRETGKGVHLYGVPYISVILCV